MITGWLSLLFFLSGLVGVLYEVVWAKCFAVILGSTATAQTLVLSIFLGGLALGNAALGRRADSCGRLLRFYGLLEFGAAGAALASPFLLRMIGADLPSWTRALLAVGVMAPATFLMGGTLPALSRLAAPRLSDLQTAVARLYCLNSAGAAFGALLAGFLLIPNLGLDGAMAAAVALNVAVAGGAMALSRRPSPAPSLPPPDRAAKSSRAQPAENVSLGLLLTAMFASGFVALGYEIAWNRLLTLLLGSSTYSFALMLSAFLAGIALGGLVVARGRHPRLGPAELLGWTELTLALAILSTAGLYDKLYWVALWLDRAVPRTPGNFYLYEAAQLGVCFLLMLLPTTLLGMTLPLAGRAAAGSGGPVGARIGLVFGLNTLGNVLGAAAAGLWLLPVLGLEGLIRAGTAFNLLIGAAVLWNVQPPGRPRKAAVAAAVVVLLIWTAEWRRAPRWDRLLLSTGAYIEAAKSAIAGVDAGDFSQSVHQNSLLYSRDDRDATVAVFKNGANVWLSINGKTDASNGSDMITQVLGAQLPLLLRPGARNMLVIGMGSGTTAGSALKHPLERLDLVEISRSVVEASRFFDDVNGRPLEDARTRLEIEDGKTFLKNARRSYDLIFSEPPNPWIAGVGNLFSIEYYRDARAHLKPGGLMVQWFHLYANDDETVKLLLRTFNSSFPHVSVWQTLKTDMLLIGSDEPLRPDYAAAAAALARPAVAGDLRRVGIDRLATLLSLQIQDESGARALAGNGPLNRDFFPRLEYAAPRALFLNSTSRLLIDADMRAAPTLSDSLYLADYLRRRRKPLTREELSAMADFYASTRNPQRIRILREWLRGFPSDSRARLALAQAQAEGSDPKAAWETLAPLARVCADAPCLDLAIQLAPDPQLQLGFLRRRTSRKR